MNVGIIGSGGREHAICFMLSKSKKVSKIFCFPGNAGTNLIAENVNLNSDNFSELEKYCIEKDIKLIIVGPEKPLVNGIVEAVSASHLSRNWSDNHDRIESHLRQTPGDNGATDSRMKSLQGRLSARPPHAGNHTSNWTS